MKGDNFRTWLITATALLVSCYFMFEALIFTELWNGDKTKISFLILALGGYFFGKLGWLAYLSDNSNTRSQYPLSWIKDWVEEGFEASQAVMTLGMIGTMVGFIMMLSGFAEVDLTDISSVQELFVSSTAGMSTALYTTLTGLSTHLLLRTGYWIFERRAF